MKKSIKRIVSSTAVVASVLAIVPLANVSATTVELKSSAHTGYCLNVYHNYSAVGTKVRLYTCSNSNVAEHISINQDANHKLHLYFKPTLCVGSSNGKAVLLHCTNSATNMTQTVLDNGKGKFNFNAGVLTAPTPSTTNPYPQLTFNPSSTNTNQIWKKVVL